MLPFFHSSEWYNCFDWELFLYFISFYSISWTLPFFIVQEREKSRSWGIRSLFDVDSRDDDWPFVLSVNVRSETLWGSPTNDSNNRKPLTSFFAFIGDLKPSLVLGNYDQPRTIKTLISTSIYLFLFKSHKKIGI
jgi:hypothetical protein